MGGSTCLASMTSAMRMVEAWMGWGSGRAHERRRRPFDWGQPFEGLGSLCSAPLRLVDRCAALHQPQAATAAAAACTSCCCRPATAQPAMLAQAFAPSRAQRPIRPRLAVPTLRQAAAANRLPARRPGQRSQPTVATGCQVEIVESNVATVTLLLVMVPILPKCCAAGFKLTQRFLPSLMDQHMPPPLMRWWVLHQAVAKLREEEAALQKKAAKLQAAKGKLEARGADGDARD